MSERDPGHPVGVLLDCRVTGIPERYHDGMTKQIAVRLPDEVVDYLDALVADGVVESRAAAVKGALERDRRRRLAEADIVILQGGEPDGLEGLADYARRVSFADLD